MLTRHNWIPSISRQPKIHAMLCAKCQELCGLVDPHRDKDFPHHKNVAELCQSAKAGCRLCTIIYTDLEGKADEVVDDSCSVMMKLKKSMGIEVSFVPTALEMGGSPRTTGTSPVIYVIFQRLELPSKWPFVRRIRLTEDWPSSIASKPPVSRNVSRLEYRI